jgi:predicted metalloprotease
MRVDGQEESSNVDDRRRQRGPAPMVLGGGMGAIVLALIVWFLTGDIKKAANVALQGQRAQPQQAAPDQPFTPEEESLAKFVRVVLKDTEDVWNAEFKKMGSRYKEPTLVLFSGSVASACGNASAAVGPFYCPADQMVYLDLAFYSQMRKQLNSPGDFAQAYVVAHEVGHHVQNLLGITEKVDQMRGTPKENQYSVRLELQADYLAGVWAHHANEMRDLLEHGDIEEAINCAKQIGDDNLQKMSKGYVQPESFTHGSSRQRAKWFTKGFKTGSMDGANELFEIDYSELE